MGNDGRQVKSRERVRERGEVFTAEREVKAMCDLVKNETERIDSTFLEPACGTGNFLEEILLRKLDAATRAFCSALIALDGAFPPGSELPSDLRAYGDRYLQPVKSLPAPKRRASGARSRPRAYPSSDTRSYARPKPNAEPQDGKKRAAAKSADAYGRARALARQSLQARDHARANLFIGIVVGLVALLIVLCILLATVVLKGSANQDKPTDGSAVRGPASSSASPFSAPPAKK